MPMGFIIFQDKLSELYNKTFPIKNKTNKETKATVPAVVNKRNDKVAQNQK